MQTNATTAKRIHSNNTLSPQAVDIQKPISLYHDSDHAMDDFRETIAAIRFSDLEKAARELRLNRERMIKGLRVNINRQPTHVIGYNILFTVVFWDDVKWFVRVPIDGHRMTVSHERLMDNEYQTMDCIKAKTKNNSLGIEFPMPTVFGWSTSKKTAGCAYGFMSYVEGTPVSDLWLNEQWLTESKRLQILESVAGSVAPLCRLEIDQIGTLSFDQKGEPSGVGPALMSQTLCHGLSNKCRTPGPHRDLQSQLDAMLKDRLTCGKDTLEFQCETELLRLLVESVPAWLMETPSALTYPDFNWEAIFVDEATCQVTGLLGWDGSRVESVARGCARYPNWIMGEWNPAINVRAQEGQQCLVEPPETLSKYRQYYSACWDQLADCTGSDPRWTRHSHILEAIVSCFTEEVSLPKMFDMLLNHAWATSPDRGRFHNFYTEKFRPCFLKEHAGMISAIKDDLQPQLVNMWRAEWEPSTM